MKAKTNCWRIIIYFVISVVSIPELAAQEYTREPQFIKNTTCLVREIVQDKWLVANYYKGNLLGTMNIVDATGTTCYSMEFEPDILVMDMELQGDSIAYFCGVKYENFYIDLGDSAAYHLDDSLYTITYDTLISCVWIRRWKAIFGCVEIDHYYDSLTPLWVIDSFPITQLRLRSLDKLELLTVPDGLHILMTGSTKFGNGCLMDAAASSPISSLWHIYVDTTDDGEAFDDVAITEKYFAASSRINRTGFIHFFPKPFSISTTTLNTPICSKQLLLPADDTILLEHCILDTLVMATYSHNESSNWGILVNKYNGPNYVSGIWMDNRYSLPYDLQLIDIKYKFSYNVLELLQHITIGNDIASVIWHVDMTMSSPSTLNGHLYKNDILTSLDPLALDNNNFLAAGNPSDWANVVRVYHYQINPYNHCANSEKNNYIISEKKDILQERLFPFISGIELTNPIKIETRQWKLHNFCE